MIGLCMPKIKKEFVVKNAQGLHARPAAIFVQIASKYNSHVTISKDEEKVNGKSIMGILTLGAQKDSRIIIEVDGDDAEAVLKDIELFMNRVD